MLTSGTTRKNNSLCWLQHQMKQFLIHCLFPLLRVRVLRVGGPTVNFEEWQKHLFAPLRMKIFSLRLKTNSCFQKSQYFSSHLLALVAIRFYCHPSPSGRFADDRVSMNRWWWTEVLSLFEVFNHQYSYKRSIRSVVRCRSVTTKLM